MIILYHPRFKKSYKKLSAELKSKAELKEKLFRESPFSSMLDTHKLHGKLKNQWSFSIDNITEGERKTLVRLLTKVVERAAEADASATPVAAR